jgi:hypothetical protein
MEGRHIGDLVDWTNIYGADGRFVPGFQYPPANLGVPPPGGHCFPIYVSAPLVGPRQRIQMLGNAAFRGHDGTYIGASAAATVPLALAYALAGAGIAELIGDPVPAPALPPPEPPAAAAQAASNPNPHNPQLVTLGTIPPATPIVVDSYVLDTAVTRRVQLTVPYTTLPRPPGWPARPSMTGASQYNVDYPKTIASGTTLALLPVEAAALVAAGAASYV